MRIGHVYLRILPKEPELVSHLPNGAHSRCWRNSCFVWVTGYSFSGHLLHNCPLVPPQDPFACLILPGHLSGVCSVALALARPVHRSASAEVLPCCLHACLSCLGVGCFSSLLNEIEARLNASCCIFPLSWELASPSVSKRSHLFIILPWHVAKH